ncbi:glycosyl hydrolase family 3 N-terminal domain protein [Bacteroides sp. CAG:1076]|nr:glycosyl hydrolase family 3 N-terminal domain protein [Bacteroides sp. CAG:1076]
MSMVPYEVSFCDYLKELVQEGEVPMSRIDDAVARVLRLKYRLGLFDNPYWDIKKYNKFGSEEFTRVALQAAEESEVLLKNEDNILPLAKGTKILLAGPNANSMRCLNGGWSYSWQGHLADQCAGAYNTIYEALCNKYGKENIIYEPGGDGRTVGRDIVPMSLRELTIPFTKLCATSMARRTSFTNRV